MTVAVFLLLWFGPLRNPGWLTPGFAAALFLIGLAAFSTGEFIREAVRKPYVIYNVVLGNQITPEDVPVLRETGYLEGGVWTRAYLAEHHPETIQTHEHDDGRVTYEVDEARLLELPHKDRVALGRVLFQYHCNDCHAMEQGYSAVAPLLRGQRREAVLDTIEHLEENIPYFMPPWAGKPEEAELITDYLMTIAPPRPPGMRPMTTDARRMEGN
jgi:hypothetical protein